MQEATWHHMDGIGRHDLYREGRQARSSREQLPLHLIRDTEHPIGRYGPLQRHGASPSLDPLSKFVTRNSVYHDVFERREPNSQVP